MNNIKVGAEYSQTLLRENDPLAIINATFNSPCVDTSGNPLPGFTSPTQCANAGDVSNDPSVGGTYDPDLLPYDLTRGGGYYTFNGHTDVKELALYAEDQITAGSWTFNAGVRGDLYNGLAIQRQAEPRVGIAYNIKRTSTVLRTSYARTLESPFNENLVLSSQGCGSAVLAPLLLCTPGVSTTLQPGFRNEFHAGLQQAIGKQLRPLRRLHLEVHPQRLRLLRPRQHPHHLPHRLAQLQDPRLRPARRRPQLPRPLRLRRHVVGGRALLPAPDRRRWSHRRAGGYPFRIDHDEKYNETTHLQYQIPGKFSPWFAFNWRYDSGLVAGATPCYNIIGANTLCAGTSFSIGGQPGVDLSGLDPDQQFQAGISCNGVAATPYSGFTQCLVSQYKSSLLSIPAP